MPIPQPKTSSVRDIEKVLSTETHSKDEIKRFKVLVRGGCLKYLDYLVPFGHQKQEDLNRLNQHVLKQDNKIYQYLFQWPIGAYARIWATGYRNRMVAGTTERVTSSKKSQKLKRRNTRTVRKRQTRKETTATADTPGSRKSSTVTFVGKTPPHMKVFSSRDASTVGVETANKVSQQERTNSPISYSTTAPAHPSEDTPLDPKTPTCSGNIRPRPSDENKFDLNYYPSPCACCGYLPAIPSEIRFGLYDLFSAIPHVVPILARSGLVHDRHLEMLRTWNQEDRQEFCDRLPRGSFSALDIAVITDLLVNVPRPEPAIVDDNAAGSAMREEVESVPWPDTTMKNLLKDSANFLSDLQHAMRLDGNKALFTRIIDLSEQYGKDFLENYKPLDQESFQQLRKTVHLVQEKEPSLQCYEDAWPVRFYLQRRVKYLAGDGENLDPSIAIVSSQALVAPTATIRRTDLLSSPSITTHSGCSIHFCPDSNQVSQFMRDFFGDHGMQELVGPLAANGVVTEKQFVLFRSLTTEQRENIVTRTDHVKPFLNLFQCILLKIALRL